MHIEEQRWAPVSAACAPAPQTGTEPEGVGFSESAIFGPNILLPFDFASPYWMCYLATSCTEFAPASYSEASPFVDFPFSTDVIWRDKPSHDVDAEIPTFWGKGRPGRIINLDYFGGDFGELTVTIVPNWGQAARKWWWSGTKRATVGQLTDVINGKAWGPFKQDNVKKRLVSLERSRLDGKFWFVLNEWKPGEAWWWGHGAAAANITSVLNGESWADFRKDGIEKRLVSLKRHAQDNWTFLMLPRSGLGWAWHPKISLDDLISEAKKNDQRVISLAPWDLTGQKYSRSDPFSAVLVQNA